MNSQLLFILLAIYVVFLLAGLSCLIRAVIGRKKIRPPLCRQRTEAPPPPLQFGASTEPARSQGCRLRRSKALIWFGLGAVLLGMLGVWSLRLALYHERQPVAEWSDGRAPALEPLIRKRCVPFMEQGRSIGLAVAIVTPTNTTIMAFGRASLASGAGTRGDTLFEIGSITKTFTGLALAREIERGTLRLDQPLQELLPPGVVLPAAARGVTLQQLATHSSGFPRMPARWSLLRGVGMLLFGSDPYVGYTEADLLEDVSTVKVRSKPGTKSNYSNFGMVLLGHLLAAKAGLSYETLVQREICLPLAMNDTTVTIEPAQASRVAQGYRAVLRCGPAVLVLPSDPWFANNPLGGAGALRSTATDMLAYLLANMRPEGSPLEPALRASHRELFRENSRSALGMNWFRTRNRQLRQTLIWHNGATGGFRSFIGFTEDSRFGVLILSNSTVGVDGLAVALLRDLARSH
jgi:CubicO group peptidase (beta-lactamase class C family)